MQDLSHVVHLIPIAATGVVGLAIIWDRVSALYFKFSINSKEFMGKIESLLHQGNLQGAIDVCASNEKALLPRVVKSGLMKATRDEAEIKTALEVSILDSSGQINNRIGFLGMIANVATLLGLLGTIAGLIASFKAVASADPATKQSLLAEGISVSMNATALGLLVAIPCLVAFSVLSGRANKLLDELEKSAGKTLALLHSRVYTSSEEDYSKISFEEVPEEKKSLKGAA